ncbi:Kazal-type serine protease inhibitor family protein [Sorangium sp. So ce1335]|uniref:Kazal-type serine protease inhibitor family protein n=1 Tax=Sorangium sp. So ce1335 TaxID=3133335 RepID=UPI003F5E0021
MRRFDGLGVLLALAASGCAVTTDLDGAAAGAAEGAIAREAVISCPAALGRAPEGAAAGGAARAASIDVGACPYDTPPPIANEGESCGGFTRGPAPVCAEGLYCDYTLEDVCGWADASGVCLERPASCTEEYMPVCGCDDRTYANACLAAMDGVAVYLKGECVGEPKRD